MVSGLNGRICDFAVSVDGRQIGVYRADGIIFSTPTGSSAYALSAGGPVMEPDLSLIEMNLICPHSLFARPMLFAPQRSIRVTYRGAGDGGLNVHADGVHAAVLHNAQSFTVTCSERYMPFVDCKGSAFYDALNGKQTRRLAFTLLCLAKYWNAVSKKPDGWVNSSDSDVMRMANINTSIKRQSLMFHNLNESGMIQFSRKVDNTNVRVCFMEDGETALHITDFRNLGYQYLKYHGANYFVCENCGITTKEVNHTTGRKQKYCSECAVQVAVQQRVNSVMKHYWGSKSSA